ncbi:hypothetical protein Tdes44962_MAKER01721 [Teratosphaeria destructans]|uniref:Uncharacterized protein n=1 Tax=Teratosphaeria destructans TaxID=418781 RepID=A0A9W7SXB0_9PEZI|nr:hypothetical protein Tdes44962_MAKER01721 [Teratosphaeria destructans]
MTLLVASLPSYWLFANYSLLGSFHAAGISVVTAMAPQVDYTLNGRLAAHVDITVGPASMHLKGGWQHE